MRALLLGALFAFALALANSSSAGEGTHVWRGHDYCWDDAGWNGAGWYRCGFAKRQGRGWGGPKGWPGTVGVGPSSGAYFERPPPTPPVSAPSIATERYVEPLRGGPAAGSPTGGSLRGH